MSFPLKPEIFNSKYLLVFILLIFCQTNSSARGFWERIISPTNQHLSSVYFVDSLYGWAVGDSGVIIHTSDGGTSWVIQNSNTQNRVTDVFFLNRDCGWATSWDVSQFPFGTYLLKTTDGGESWISPSQPEEDIFSQCVLFLDSLNGWMGGKPE